MKPAIRERHLLGTNDLFVLMPIKQGFIDNLETRTFATRLRLVMRTFDRLRKISRERRSIEPFSDSVERIRSIHFFDLSILPGERQLLLVVSFDRPWEPYIRLIWRGLGPMLDVLLVNCQGYEDHMSERGFECFARWVREHQISTDFLYTHSERTVDDISYLEQLERRHREGDPRTFDSDSAALVIEDPRARAVRTRAAHRRGTIESGLGVLGAMYRLRELHLPNGSADDILLLRATQSLLERFDTKDLFPDGSPLRLQHGAELSWFERDLGATNPVFERPTPRKSEIQGGILTPYAQGEKKVTHGSLILGRVVDAARARAFLKNLRRYVTTEEGRPQTNDGVYLNVAFTFRGLKRLGVGDSLLDRFPPEFREGMEARAGLLGDVRSNHPDNWDGPEWNLGAPPSMESRPVIPRVRMSSVDFLIQLRSTEPTTSVHDWVLSQVEWLSTLDGADGARLLSNEPMEIHRDSQGHAKNHFGFADNLSQPKVVDHPTGRHWDDRVLAGEMLLGHRNGRGDSPYLPAGEEPHNIEATSDARCRPAWTQGSLLDNGSFLVVRKLEQDVEALESALAAQSRTVPKPLLLSKMMGRTQTGDPLAAPGATNDFTFGNDQSGERCPFAAHIRRANPRTDSDHQMPVPRIARRGMSYGPTYEEAPSAERGLMFLAYNASIAEQFEVIQRWISGGNSTDVYSGHRDPFLAVPEDGDRRTFKFLDQREVVRCDLGQRPFVNLKWGAYFFVPSMVALESMAGEVLGNPSDQVERGTTIIRTLEAATDKRAAWKTILEDVVAKHSGSTDAVFAAIRAKHGGVLETDYGVLVASHALAMQVLGRTGEEDRFSVEEYRRRMTRSIGEIYLGLDRSAEYRQLADGPNRIVSEIAKDDALRIAWEVTSEILTRRQNAGLQQVSLHSLADTVLARLSTYWFDIPDGEHIEAGGRPQDTDSAHCPFHFLAPSRYIFSSPNPSATVEQLGQAHGKLVLQRTTAFVKSRRKSNQALHGSLSRKLFALISDDDELGRTLVGVLEGFLPTVYGNFLRTLHLWMSTEELWRVQQDLYLSKEQDQYSRAEAVLCEPLKRAMQARPVPDIVHRRATKLQKLGDFDVTQAHIDGNTPIVVSIASATQDLLGRGRVDVTPVFGGDRTAKRAPTHACPAYQMGMGVLLGMVGAVLEAGPLKLTGAPLVLSIGPEH